jgi:hypothetical protein
VVLFILLFSIRLVITAFVYAVAHLDPLGGCLLCSSIAWALYVSVEKDWSQRYA